MGTNVMLALPSASAPDREPRRSGRSRGQWSCSHRRQGLAAPASAGYRISSDRHRCMLVTQSWQPCNHKHWQQQEREEKKKKSLTVKQPFLGHKQ